MSRQDETIFILSEEGTLDRVPRAEYETEDLLQRLLDDHPDLLAGDQIQPETPLRWLAIAREVGIPDSAAGTDRWAVDHLLLDQFARPTLVEVKRSKDRRIRREVVGQMLDYAANAQTYWPIDRIRALAAERYGGPDRVEEELRRILGDGSGDDPSDRLEGYWAEVEENLRNGNVRLLFVADELPRELRRVIEFLNQQMPRVDVLGVEVRQYVGQSIKALVPRLVGQTEFARQAKQPMRSRGMMDRQSFLNACPDDVARFFEDLLVRASESNLTTGWGKEGFSIRFPRPGGELCSIFYAYPAGMRGKDTAHVQVYLGNLKPEDDVPRVRQEFLAVAPFRESGKHTLELVLTPDLLRAAERVMSVLFAVCERHSRGR